MRYGAFKMSLQAINKRLTVRLLFTVTQACWNLFEQERIYRGRPVCPEGNGKPDSRLYPPFSPVTSIQNRTVKNIFPPGLRKLEIFFIFASA
ncbi:hypothetical protein CRP01_08960 [Flavilitoribacter nigricans DSM 23189 = NBRC 102662]|uniref:Uncharacterized protein n=1 Tax=Flavilitoribacter nigricans (strain ATCC 23147 / DSM 23189 / NBRC 102662 / NCIMB 1420 / SS-2) TaxID=1122177 RepID=A0A2D0NEN4_FLAN2|nr:hypothetical protein CRP01_08960 [Flavilitoribacter nigricans DSM 23189 = NBRC 102662]